MTEIQNLAALHDYSRKLLHVYLKPLEGVDPYKRYKAYGAKLNSIYWLVGHITWAEHNLALRGVVGKPMNIPWLDKFAFGTTLETQDGMPDFATVMSTLNQVHEETQRSLNALDDSELDKPNLIPNAFGESPKKRVLQHMIRHEPMHQGQLGWICKMNGVKMF
jgi:DinB superfamily